MIYFQESQRPLVEDPHRLRMVDEKILEFLGAPPDRRLRLFAVGNIPGDSKKAGPLTIPLEDGAVDLQLDGVAVLGAVRVAVTSSRGGAREGTPAFPITLSATDLLLEDKTP